MGQSAYRLQGKRSGILPAFRLVVLQRCILDFTKESGSYRAI